jgi:hypothetical protein
MNEPSPDLPDFPEFPDELLERMREQSEELRKRRMEVEREWPPKEATAKKWGAYGLECAIARGSALCGYVRISADHPDAKLDYDAVDVDVHGGLTFRCKTPDGGAWFGFDCAHSSDWVGFGDIATIDEEGVGSLLSERPGRIWTIDEVVEETERLAEQFAERANVKNG